MAQRGWRVLRAPIPFLRPALGAVAAKVTAVYYAFLYVGFGISCQDMSCVEY
jgi:hypothetical protein